MTTAKDLPQACWLCGRNGNGDPLDAHHIFGGANRRLSEKYGLVVPLCHRRCHELGPQAAHRNRETMQRLHEWGQAQVMERGLGLSALADKLERMITNGSEDRDSFGAGDAALHRGAAEAAEAQKAATPAAL